MKRLLLICLILISTQADAQLTSGLVGHWSFNGNANDGTGNGLNGTGTNVTYTTGKHNLPNTAARFNGSSSIISVPYKSNLNLTKFSICALVKVEGYYGGLCQTSAILWRGSQWQNGYYSLIYFDNPFDLSCSIADTSKNVFAGQMGNLIATPSPTQWRYTPTIVSKKWYCVITTFDSVQSKIYVDGVLKSTYNVSPGSIGSSTEGLAMGGNIFGGASQYPYWMNGVIDDIRLYNRALSPAEVASYCSLFDTAVTITDSVTKIANCMDDTMHLSYTVSSNFQPGNVFTAQLSDASGSFSNPINIGTLASVTQGKIICTIPTGLTPGNGYHLRIISTNPVRISDVSTPIGIYTTLIPAVTISTPASWPVAANQYVLFKAQPSNAGANPTYQWYKNGQPIFGEVFDSLYTNTLNDNDSIYVVVFSSNPCPADLFAQSNTIVAKISQAVYDLVLPNLSLFPNPNKGIFTIKADPVSDQPIHCRVLNSVGQQILSRPLDMSGGTINESIDLQGAAPGVYMLQLSNGSQARNIRFTISR